MQYIQLNNETFMFSSPTGTVQVNNRMFNYNKIVKAVKNGADIEEVNELLKVPDLPDGVFEAYLVEGEEDVSLIYKNFVNNQTPDYTSIGGNPVVVMEDKTKFIGIYDSVDSIIEDWPEFTL